MCNLKRTFQVEQLMLKARGYVRNARRYLFDEVQENSKDWLGLLWFMSRTK